MRNKFGFSLVELSIVLVILGLLTGGILAGQSLIRAAELRSVTTERNRYYTGIQTFRDKYFSLPGDMNNATSFWGKSTTLCNSASGNAGTPGTCNGTGNGLISHNSCADNDNESFLIWQHMQLAGLIEGSYTGAPTSAGLCYNSAGGTNVPLSKLNNAGWYIGPGYRADDRYFSTTLAWLHFMQIGGMGAGGYAEFGVLKPEEAWNIDKKVDDGLPAQGGVHSYASGTTYVSCTTGTTTTATYNLTDTGKRCALIFPLN